MQHEVGDVGVVLLDLEVEDLGIELDRFHGQNRPVEEPVILQGARVPAVRRIRDDVPPIVAKAPALREDARRLPSADGRPVAKVGEQRPQAPGQRTGGGLEVAPAAAVRLAARVLAVPVQQSIQEAPPDVGWSAEDLRGNPLVPGAASDQSDQQMGKGRTGCLDLLGVLAGPVVADSGDAEAAEEPDDARGQLRLITVQCEADLAVDMTADETDVSFGGVDPEQVAELVVERDAVGESRPGLVSPVLRLVGWARFARLRRRKVLWQGTPGKDVGPRGPERG